MNIEEFETAIASGDRVTVVDVWAPWCGPCKMMKPVFEKLAEEYSDQVQVLRINADESSEVVQKLEIFAIPTVVAFNVDGSEAGRRTGAQREGDLRDFFRALLEGRAISSVSNRDRVLRIVVSIAIALMAREVNPSWPLYILAAGFFFAAIHDRCPLWQTVKRTVRSWRRKTA